MIRDGFEATDHFIVVNHTRYQQNTRFSFQFILSPCVVKYIYIYIHICYNKLISCVKGKFTHLCRQLTMDDCHWL